MEQQNKRLCSKCKNEVGPTTEQCKNCGTDNRNWFKRHPVLTGVFVIPFVIAVIYNASTTFVDGIKNTNPTEAPATATETLEQMASDKPKVEQFWIEFSKITKDGDKNDAYAKNAMINKKGYNLYLSMSAASTLSSGTSDKLYGLKIPQLGNKKFEQALKDGTKLVAEAYQQKWLAYSKIADMVNSHDYEEIASKQSGAANNIQNASEMSLSGVKQIMIVIVAYDVKLK